MCALWELCTRWNISIKSQKKKYKCFEIILHSEDLLQLLVGRKIYYFTLLWMHLFRILNAAMGGAASIE